MGLLCPPLSEGLDKQVAVTCQSGNNPQVSTLVNHNNHDILRLRCHDEGSISHKLVSVAVGDTACSLRKKGNIESCYCSGKNTDLLLDTTKIKEDFVDDKVWEYPPPNVSSTTRNRFLGYSPKHSIRPNKSNFKAGIPSSIVLGFDSPAAPYCIGDCLVKDEVPKAITVEIPRPSELLSEDDMVVSSSVSFKKNGPLLQPNPVSSSDLLEAKQVNLTYGPESYWFLNEPYLKPEVWPAARKTPSKPSASHRQGLSPSFLPLSPLGPKSGLLDAGSAGNLLSPCKGKLVGTRATSCSPCKRHYLASELYIKQCSAASEDFTPTILHKAIENCDVRKSFPGTPKKKHGLCGSDSNFGHISSYKTYTGVPARRSLVGSFEESLLSGHFLSGHSSQSLDGFQALLSVSGGCWSPPTRKLPFSVTYVDGDNIQLYYASIDIAGDVSCIKAKSTKIRSTRFNEESQGIKRRYRIPMRGRVQLVLSNPELTPVHTFVCSYDLTDMPSGTKTFMRHKVSLKSSPIIPKNVCAASYENIFARRSPSALTSPQSMVLLKDKTNKEWEYYMNNQTEKELPMKLRAAQGHYYRGTSSCEDHGGKCADLEKNRGRKMFVQTDADKEDINVHIQLNANGVNHESISKPAKAELSEKWYSDSMRTSEGLTDDDIHAKSGRSSDHGGTVLRYALHLKFMCTPAKCGQSEAVPTSIGEESLEVSNIPSWARNVCNVKDARRFYLYGDLRVVFPQRQSDADEGKLEAQYDFPADPKYFEFGF